ncbi:peptidoglycan DD-metalloendopeptidase family protein [Gymnodinialimonas ulvae]|uniref:peptidoglycan DD-metalloendopeptidase family protein n=1 Tax=Gymnodinialimonas ulvae TaxID=3126504 RepID=UPI00309B660C
MRQPFVQFARRSLFLLAPLALAACVGAPPDWDFDFRPNAPRGAAVTAERPAPDSRGLISYDSYQVAVARRGDTVSDVATRIGLGAEELAAFNGRSAADTLRDGEVLALPRRIDGGTRPGAGNSDIANIARGAIDAADASRPAASGPQIPTGQEPVRHRIARGETAYSVARLYGVSVRSLAEWNGLGPDLAVREGQFLLIPIVVETAAATDGTAPGTSVAPLPPSASSPLPDGIETATLPDLEGTGTGTTAAAPAAEAAPAPAAPAQSNARLIRPVDGSILRGYGSGNEGIDIAASAGTPVRAAADGTVAAITQDTDQVPILVVRHADGLLTVYANIQNIRVSRGDSVSRGATVAEVGPGDPSFLHFEVRRGFEAVDPGDFLP